MLITGYVAQPICEVSFTLATQACDPVGWNAFHNIGRQPQCLQEFQPIQEPGCTCRLPTHFELSQPDEPADLSIHDLGQQCVQPFLRLVIKPLGNTTFYFALRRN